MLDIRALQAQLAEMSASLAQQSASALSRLEAARTLLARAGASSDALSDRLDAYAAFKDAPWPIARPLEPLDGSYPLPAGPARWSVVATDGSQIAPSHHEIALCYVINVGRILYSYGTGERPLQDSVPRLFHREEDMRPLVGKRPMPVTEDLIAAFRNREEWRSLASLAVQALARAHPAIALVDGSLIQWPLEDKPEELLQELLGDHLAALEQLREIGVPVAGYLSNARSAEVVNLLRLVACPFETLACESCAWREPPCGEAHVPLSDRRLFGRTLGLGERSALFASSARILSRYGAPQRVAFFYLNVGAEIARLEVPMWVAEAPDLLNRLHALAFDQAQKGHGYPIALQEAHNQAVVGREDRMRFFALLQQRMISAGLPAAVSHKQLKKRFGVV